jgi:hypothetical protein
MPALDNARHEAFAQARARGARVEEAYEDAGFTPGNDHGALLACRNEVAERIAELRAQQTDMEQASTQAVIAALLRVVKCAEAATTPAAIREIRLTLLDVDRLRATIDYDRQLERAGFRREINHGKSDH